MTQRIITSESNYAGLDNWLSENTIKKAMLVCDKSLDFLTGISKKLEEIEQRIALVRFSDFCPNPAYESVVRGVNLFRKEDCDAILAIGGGSAIDVAKCIRIYAGMDSDGAEGAYLKAEIPTTQTPFLVMPTTAGTGSEATRYAVIYFEGKKQSVTSEFCIPETILMDPTALSSLPIYQRKATMMDAFCHAIESFWSVNSTDESKEYSKTAIRGILQHMEGYLANEEKGNAGMLLAAHEAGKAINLTQTTAGHAMSYKLTSLFHVAHGHATALCDRVLFPYMIEHIDLCRDERGKSYLKQTLDEIGQTMGCKDARKGAEKLLFIFDSLKFEIPKATTKEFEELKTSVNPDRLKNHPIALDEEDIDTLYHRILEQPL